MVCLPCFIIPVLLYVWHRFIQPYVLRYWNPWAKKDKDGNIIKEDNTKFPFDCSGGKCTFMAKGKVKANETESETTTTTEKLAEIPAAEAAIKTDIDKKQE